MKILIWHVHGSWTTSFVQGPHHHLIPVNDRRDADVRGRADTWEWPESAVEVPLDRLGSAEPDVVVLQRPHEPRLVEELTGRVPGGPPRRLRRAQHPGRLPRPAPAGRSG